MRTQFVAAWSAFIYDVSIGFAKYSFRLRCRGALAAEFTVDLGAVPFGQTAAQTVLRSAGLSSSNSNIEKGASAGPRAIFRQLIFMQTGIKTLLMTIAAVTAMDAASAAGIKELDTVEGIKSYELDNGLKIVLFADQSKPTATVNTTYLVGSRMENYGETGMAHLLEHLMFKGSKNYPDPTKEFTRRGFRMNGTTWLDRTNYFVSFTANDDNMRWALGWSADAMVNSFIAKKDLDTEMTVVRNEYEMGENKPVSVMLKRMQSVLFDWHAYGRSTIGARSDIENVPIENLQAFYRKWYQPDNAVLTVSGKFDEAKVLEWISETFGKIKRPERVLPREWTVEPTADGAREFEIRRPGEMQLVAVGYRIPSALAEDCNAVETAVDILSESPRGRLYKELVESGQASQVFGWALSAKNPGFVMFGAMVKKGDNIEVVKNKMIDVIERTFAKKPATDEEVKTSLAEAAIDYERTLSDPEQFAVDLSDYIALGDWRLFFADRDSTAKVTPAAVNEAAATYFVRDNRVVGKFIPDDHPRRAPYMTTPDVKEVIAKTTFKREGDVAEAFDVSQANIDARTERLSINGVDVALLPKKTRGQTVTVLTSFQYGNLETTTGKTVLNYLVEPMLSRGTDQMDRKHIADRQTELKVQGDVLGFTTTAPNVVNAIELMGNLIARSTFPEKEFDQFVRQLSTMLESRSDDPIALGRDALLKHFEVYPLGDPRNPTRNAYLREELGKVSRDEVYDWFVKAVSNGHGQVAVVGDFDPAAVKAALEKSVGNKKNADPKYDYKRYWSEYKPVAADRILIDTPSKENAAIFARVDFPANVDDADAPALVVADWIMGGGTGLSNRLVDRLRQKEGLSYGVGSRVRLPRHGNRASWNMSAIVAPQNLLKAEECAREEIARIVKEGVTQTELDEAKKGILQSRAVSRAQDDYLAHSWVVMMDSGKTFADSKKFEDAISRLTLEEVNAAVRKMLVEKNITFVLAGDLAKGKVK